MMAALHACCLTTTATSHYHQHSRRAVLAKKCVYLTSTYLGDIAELCRVRINAGKRSLPYRVRGWIY